MKKAGAVVRAGLACALFAGVPLGAQNADKPGTVAPPTFPSRVRWRKVVVNAASDFEAACAADINGDGKLDIVCGDTWYKAPDWTPHKFRDIGVWGRDANNSGYRADFADIPIDVNGDGSIDVVSSDYATGQLFWHENPGPSAPPDTLWQKHLIATPGSAETTIVAPLLGKSAVCILPNCGNQVVWYELRKNTSSLRSIDSRNKLVWVEHKVGAEGAGHGIGWGDVNGDGKPDLITPRGWYENVDARSDKWTWHKDWECSPGDLGIGTPTLDVTGEGHNSVIFGSGHHYGLYWLQQTGGQRAGANNTPGAAQWTQTTIDNTWSQAHALLLADLEGTRQPVILTGKRYKAHDHDPGANDPLGLYYYRYDRKAGAWQKYVIDQNTQAGTGLVLTAADLRHTKRLDIIAPGKSGLYLFLNDGLDRRRTERK